MGKAISLLRPPQPPRDGEGASAMELRKRPRPRRVDPDFVSSPPREQLRKRARRQAPQKRPRDAAGESASSAKWLRPLKRARCSWWGVVSTVVGLHPATCCRQASPLPPRASRRIRRPRHPFSWYEPDMWTEVAKHLHGYDLVCLSLTCRWFRRLVADDSIWRYAFLRDLHLLTVYQCPPRPPRCSWRLLYAAAFNGSHAYCFRQREKHLDWLRIGGFLLDSPYALLTGHLPGRLWLPPEDAGVKISIEMTGACRLRNARPGIWIADVHLVRCPVCNLHDCEGTMQVLDARHCEVFLEKSYVDGTWEYEDLGEHFIDEEADAASGAIFNAGQLDTSAPWVFNTKSWIATRTNLQPRALSTPFAVAINTNLQPNQGLLVRFKAMRDTNRDGQIVCVRITQQLI
ncbi:hypothetical protein ACP4OV_020904 [Aristida adscensionis]